MTVYIAGIPHPGVDQVCSPGKDVITLAAQTGDGPAAGQSELSFAKLLRRLRAEARLTQEELAEAASLSPRSISDLERSINLTARKATALLLADALGLAEPLRTLFVAAARGRAPASAVLSAGDRSPSAALPAATGAVAGDAEPLAGDVTSLIDRRFGLAQLMAAVTSTAADSGGGILAIYVIGWMTEAGTTVPAMASDPAGRA